MPIERSEGGLKLWRPQADGEHMPDFAPSEIRRFRSACLIWRVLRARECRVVRFVAG